MAPGIDGLPAAERDVDVSGPVAEFLALGLAAASWPGSGSACAPSSGCPSPGASAASTPRPARTSCASMEGSRFGLHHDLLLMAKLFSTLGYAVDPRGRGADRLRDRAARSPTARCPSRPARSATPSPRGEGEECDVVIVGSGRRRRRRRGDAGRGRARRDRARGRRALQPRQLPERPRSTRSPTLYRDGGLTIAEGRPPIPVPVAKVVGGTTVINSGTCFRAPEPVLEDWRERFGIDWASDLDADFAEAEESLHVTPARPRADGPQRPAGDGGRGGARRQRRPDLTATPATACSAAPAPSAARSTPSAACTSATCRAPSPPGRGSAPGSRRDRVLVEDGRAVGVALRRPPRRATARRRAYTVRARRADDRRRRRPRHAGAAAALRPRRQAGRPQPPHPPRLLGRRPLRGGGARLGRGDAELLRRRVGAAAGSCSRRPSPRSPSAAPGCSAPAREHQRAMLDFGHVGSIGVHLSDQSAGRVGLGADGSLRASYKLTDERRRPARLRHRPRRRSPLRRRRHRGLPQHRPGRRPQARRPGRVRGDPLQALGAAPGGLPPDGHGPDRRRPARGRLRHRRLGPRHRRTSTSPTPRSSPPRSASTR